MEDVTTLDKILQSEDVTGILKRGDKLCSERTLPMSSKMISKVKDIYEECRIQTNENPLISASRLGLVNIVWGFIECAKQTNTNLYNKKPGEFSDFVWKTNKLKETPLDVAIKEGHVEVAKLLMETADLWMLISGRNRKGKAPVSMLCSKEHDKFVWSIMERKTSVAPASTFIQIDNISQESDVNITERAMHPLGYPRGPRDEKRKCLEKLNQGELELTPNNNTVLHLISKIGNISYANEILKKHPFLLYRRNFEGETPAYLAAREGHVDILADMIIYFKMKNDDIESLFKRSTDSHNALHIAIQNHHVGAVFWLIKEVPQLANLINDRNESPIYLAAERGYSYLLNQMLKKCERKKFEGPKGKTALHAAAISGSRDCVKYLLREGIDQYIRDEQGWMPLQHAVHHNNIEAVAELVALNPMHGHIKMIEDDITTYAIHIAASRGYCKILKLLKSRCYGCVELVDGKGKNIFHVAVENKQIKVIEFIYRDELYTSLVNKKDKNGNTPIHLLMASDLEMMEVAMDYRVNINVMNNENLTPLNMASSSEKRKKLLERVAVNTHIHKIPSLNKSVWDEKRTAEEFKLVEYLLIVATLIATATFAAAFAVPGGYDGNEGSDQGIPILLRKTAFKAYVVTNTWAFASACSVLGTHVVLLVYRLKSNEVDEEHRKKIHTRILGMYYLTGFALLEMVVAFIAGIYVVISPIPGLAIYLCVTTVYIPFMVILFPALIGPTAGQLIDCLWWFGMRKRGRSTDQR